MSHSKTSKIITCILIVAMQMATFQSATAVTLAPVPKNISSDSSKPMVMLASSKDHTLFSPIYSDFEDLDGVDDPAGDGVIDTTFKPTFKYYGYFDSVKCYTYSTANKRFEPASSVTAAGLAESTPRYACNTAQSYWSGNFLNWATMTRLDVVRKMLYGGKRSTDDVDLTVLERANLSQDAHSFVKFYAGTDIRDYTPYSTGNLTKTTGVNANAYAGLTICNRSSEQGTDGTPQIRLAKGNYRMWATIETKTCVWTDESPDTSQVKLGTKLARYYKNTQTYYGGATIAHESALPTVSSDGAISSTLSDNDLTVRVKVCDPSLLGNERCEARTWTDGSTARTTYKPIGLLQEFGMPTATQSSAKAELGLITGSYDKNLTAGALRKNIGDLTMEVSKKSGRLCKNASSSNDACTTSTLGAIASLDNIILYGRGSSGYGTLKNTASQMADGTLPAWGNPMGEMLVQAFNYFAGNSSTNPTSTTNDTSAGIPIASWNNPLSYTATSDPTRTTNYGKAVCRSLNVIALSSSALSFDQDAATVFSGLPARQSMSLADYTNRIGLVEGINGSSRTIGSNANGFGSNCTAKTVGNLSDVSGICPEAPAVGGTYQAAGAALYGNTTKIQDLTVPSDFTGTALNVKTTAASLAGGVARIEVLIPNSNPQKYVYIVPEGLWANGPASMLTFSSISSSATHGAFLVTWNDALFGGDHDMDATGYLRYDIIAPGQSYKSPKTGTNNTSDYKIQITSDLVNVGSGASGGTHGYSVIGVNNGTAAASSTSATDSADGLYLTHGHSNYNSFGVSTATSMCANNDYRQTGQASGGTYTVSSYPNHIATRTVSSGTVYNPCFNSSDHWTVRDIDLPVAGTFTMRGAENVLLKDPLWYAAKYGGYNTAAAGQFAPHSTSDTNALPTAAWDTKRADGKTCGGTSGLACNDGVPDNYFLARRPDLLEKQLRTQLEQIVAASNAAPAVSTSQLITGSKKYVAQFDPSAKSGSIFAYELNSSGVFNTAATFNVGEKLSEAAWTSRRIITNTDNTVGAPFQWTNVQSNTSYKQDLTGVSDTSMDTTAQNMINYMRGDRSNESPNGERFQPRSGSNILGTIVNSTPTVQTRPVASYLDYQFSDNPKYSTFARSNASRPSLLWTGSNDGMLHAFKPDTGEPVLSYVPRPLVSTLKDLAAISTTIAAGMDGSPFVGDVRVKDASNSWVWKSYVFSHLGRGGRGIFALDATDTATLSGYTTTNVESTLANIFQWQFTSSDDADLGNVLTAYQNNRSSNQASPIIRLNTGDFAVLVPNGINSGNGKAKLLILKAQGPGADKVWTKGTDYYVLETLASDTNNGMMGATWIDTDLNGTADYVYSTDLKGNVWKFDISSSDPTEWGSAFKVGTVNVPLYTAQSSAGTPLAITTEPTLYLPTRGGTMVVFGTGKSLTQDDFPVTSYQNRMFGIYDRSGTGTFTLPSGTSNLQQRAWTEITTGTSAGSVYESGSTTTLDLSTKDGWYFDYPSTSEMLLSSPSRFFGQMLFTTVRAASNSSSLCFNAPPGRLWVINPIDGKASDFFGSIVINDVTYAVGGIASSDQIVRVVGNRTSTATGGGTTTTTTTTCNSYLGATTLGTKCMALKARIQWREVPGFSTSTN